MKNLISLPTLKRLPTYFRIFSDALAEGKNFISSQEIAEALGIDQTQVRKDITATGYVGKPKIGFETKGFIDHLKVVMKLHKQRKAIIIGLGNLGLAIAKYKGFSTYGLNVLGLFDVDPQKVGLKVQDCEIRTFAEVHDFVKQNSVDIAILTVPYQHAQEVANTLISSGIKGIWNFTTVHLKTPKNVIVWDQDLIAGLMMLLILMEQEPSPDAAGEKENKSIYICMGSACHQHGAFKVLNEMKELVKMYSLDDRVELKGAFCLGNCAEGINARIDDVLISGISPDNIGDKFRSEILTLLD
jgi:redox-sensing transcriptional repressor